MNVKMASEYDMESIRAKRKVKMWMDIFIAISYYQYIQKHYNGPLSLNKLLSKA